MASSGGASIDTPVVTWRVFGDDDEEPTVKNPEFTQALASSIGETGENPHAKPEPVQTVTPAPAVRAPRRRRGPIVGAAMAFAVAVCAALLLARGVSPSEVARESTAAAQAFVGCPALPQLLLTRAEGRSPVLVPKQSTRHLVAHAPQRARPPRAVARTPAPHATPRGGIIRKIPF